MSIQETNPAGAKELVEGSEAWAYVDVRTPEEFQAGHVPGAFNVPIAFRGAMGMQLNEDFLATMQKHFETGTRLVLGCAAGVRSMRACEVLDDEGYENLVNMNGGMMGATDPMGTVVEPGWQACGFPVTNEARSERTWEALQTNG